MKTPKEIAISCLRTMERERIAELFKNESNKEKVESVTQFACDTVERGFEMGYRFAHDEDRMIAMSKILAKLSKEEGGEELLAEFEKKIAGEKNETDKTSD